MIHAEPRPADLPLPDGGEHRLLAAHRPRPSPPRSRCSPTGTCRTSPARRSTVPRPRSLRRDLGGARSTGSAAPSRAGCCSTCTRPTCSGCRSAPASRASASSISRTCSSGPPPMTSPRSARMRGSPFRRRWRRRCATAMSRCRRKRGPAFDADAFAEAYAILGAARTQDPRGLRPARRPSRKSPVSPALPRMRGYLARTLAHPVLSDRRASGMRGTCLRTARPTDERRATRSDRRPEFDWKVAPIRPKRAMVLAAGLGKRMRPITATDAEAADRGRRPRADRPRARPAGARRRRAGGGQRPLPRRSSSAFMSAGAARPEIVISDETRQAARYRRRHRQGAAASRRPSPSICSTPIPSGSRGARPNLDWLASGWRRRPAWTRS